MISRRFFIGSCLAASASAGYGALKAAVASKPIAKIGVLSDVHLKVPGDEDTFLKALEYFRDNGADGVLVAGDIADTGKISELKRAADFYLPNSQCGKKNTCVFSFDELPQKGRYVFSVRPIECFGKKGAAKASKVFRIR